MVTRADVGVGLYRHLLGDAVDALAPVVRAVHVDSPAVNGHGTLELRALHRLAGVATRGLGLPPPGGVVPLQLGVVRSPSREVWVRLLADRALVTEQHANREGELVERSGRGELHFRLGVQGGDLRFRSCGAALHVGSLRIPLPGPLAPRVSGTASANADGRRLVVHLTVGGPVVGDVLTYHVELEPSS